MPVSANFKYHDPALDGIRGLAVSLVLFHHLVYSSGIDRKFWFDWQVFRLADSCWLGVDLFFVLSGFLITGILYEAKSSAHYFRNFYGRRVLRIFPLYYGFLFVTFFLIPPWLSSTEATQSFYQAQGWYWLFLSNVHITLYNWPEAPIGHFWSLAIEEQFYLIWPFLVYALDRRHLLRVTVICMVIALVLRLWLPFDMGRIGGYVLLPTRMDSLAAGAFLALIIRGQAGTKILGRLPVILTVACAVILAAVYLWYRRLEPLNPLVATVGYSVIAIGFAAFMAMAVSAPPRFWLRRALSGALLVALGRYSYGLYVIHVPVIWYLKKSGLQADLFPRLLGSSLPGVLVFGAVGLTISVALAMLSYHYWETPFLRLKRYLPYRGGTLTHASAGEVAAEALVPGKPEST